MESKNTISYNVNDSAKRIDDILNSSNSNFSDTEKIPARNSLTYNNGCYVNVTALFVDVIGSSDMTDDHKRPTLAKIYRSFISECVAIMNSEKICREISIHGDCVWSVLDTPLKKDIDTVFNLAYSINSMIQILNYKLGKKSFETIEVGISIDDGRALMIQAGYSGSSINDIIWMGDVVNSASNLANEAGRKGRKTIIVTPHIYENLNEHNQELLTPIYDSYYYHGLPTLHSFSNSNVKAYEGNTINTKMQEWYEGNCK